MKLSDVNKKLGSKQITIGDIKNFKVFNRRFYDDRKSWAKWYRRNRYGLISTTKGFEDWMLKSKPIDIICESGCFSDKCGDDDIISDIDKDIQSTDISGCWCSDFHYNMRLLMRRGFQIVASLKNIRWMFSDGNDIIYLDYDGGR